MDRQVKQRARPISTRELIRDLRMQRVGFERVSSRITRAPRLPSDEFSRPVLAIPSIPVPTEEEG